MGIERTSAGSGREAQYDQRTADQDDVQASQKTRASGQGGTGARERAQPLNSNAAAQRSSEKDEARPSERLEDQAARNAAMAGAVSQQQAGRAQSSVLPPAAKATQGYASAQGTNGKPQDDIVSSAAEAVRKAPAKDRAQVQNVVERLGVALNDGKLVGSEKLREVLYEAASQPTGGSKQTGALAHLTRAAEVIDRVRLAPGTAVAFDPSPPQNAQQVKINQEFNSGVRQPYPASVTSSPEAAAKLPVLDKEMVDADLYYRQDNRGRIDRALDRLIPGARNAQQPLTLESVKSTATAFADKINEKPKAPATTTQVSRQAAWQKLETGEQPRQFKAAMPDAQGFSKLMSKDALDKLGKMTLDYDARNFTIGDRSYSMNELRDIRLTGKADVDARTAKAVEASGGKADPAGSRVKNQAAVYGNDPLQALPEGRLPGKPNPPLAPLAQPPELPGAKQGGALGALAGFGVSTVASLADGKVTGNEARSVATNTVAGGAVGAVSAKAEQLVSPAIKELADNSGSTAAKNTLGTSLGSRLMGSTAVGAVVSLGMSAYDNREGLAKGDSKAIGNVTADTAIGATSVAAGAVLGAAATGALAGSVVPVVGTAIGAAVGIGVGVAITYGSQLSGVREGIANGVAGAVDGAKNLASDTWNGFKGMFG
jgi:hypothetical protein